jgi:hypothetical protein
MAPRRPSRGLRARIDQEIAELDIERGRLVAAREALERDKAPRISQDEIAGFLEEHPGSTYLEIAGGLKTLPRNVAAHLKRGKKAGRFVNDPGGRWSIESTEG